MLFLARPRPVLFRERVLFRAPVLFRDPVLFRALERVLFLEPALFFELLFRALVLFRARVLFRELVPFRPLVLFRALVLFREPVLFRELVLFRFRVAAAFRAEAERDDLVREAAARPPFLPPFRDELRLVFLPRPEPLFLPPPVSLFTVAQARRSASPVETPRSSYPSSICRACRFCFDVYEDLSPRAMIVLPVAGCRQHRR